MSTATPSAATASPLPAPRDSKLRRMANAIRALAMDAVEQVNSGHPGMPMGMADVATVLFTQFLRFDPRVPDWPDRDRFVLSAGHGSMLLYALLHLTGYADITLDELKRFRQLGSRTAGHPERGHAAGIETTTGPLGQGIGNSVGMALAERMLAAEFGDEIVDHHTYVIASDGDLMEGVSHEAASLAGHLGLNKLIVLYDDNSISIDGPTELSFSDDPLLRFRGYGWAAERIDGHDHAAIAEAIWRAQTSDRPNLIACRTTIAFGAPTKAGTAAAHGAPLGAAEIAGARQRLGWSEPPFVIPEDIRAEWRAAGARGEPVRRAWETRLNALAWERRAEFLRRQRRELPPGLDQAIAKLCHDFRQANAKIATRQASGTVLDTLTRVVPELVGGSADLTPSNNTKAKDQKDVRRGDYSGRYIRYGVREHGMAAAMNGIAVHGGLIPYGGDFLTFFHYSRPPVRLAPCLGGGAPPLLALPRQSLPLLRREPDAESRSARGAYVLAEADGERQVTLLATGSEVSVAMAAREALGKEGVRAAVVSMPCWEIFDKAPKEYQDAVLGSAPRVAVEAAVRFGWDRWLGPRGAFIGMEGFGASAPGEALFPPFGITPEKGSPAARSLL